MTWRSITEQLSLIECDLSV